LHIHGIYYETTEIGVQMYKGRALNEVIANIEIFDDYYAKATLCYLLSENSALLSAIRDFKKSEGTEKI
jgi:hypothetical protein